ncbi:MAG: cysteine desulfurase [Flavobacteriales bacterium]|nr:cysteine desulfurase [Flavobacteriales bacterium]
MADQPRIYLDNAASTPLDPEVLDAMMPYLKGGYGNPSSIHHAGREARAAIEKARKQMAAFLGVSPSEIYFTSGGTEADNFALRMSVEGLGVKKIITSPVEHHAVLNTALDLARQGKVVLELLPLDKQGRPEWEGLLDRDYKETTLVSLMHANNELGTVLPLKKLAPGLKEKNVLFHSDMVQTIGHFDINLTDLEVGMASASAHKYHGPKGAGFLFVHSDIPVTPILTGGAQERNLRAGTENVPGIIGMAKALELAYRDMQVHRKHIEGLKDRLRTSIMKQYPEAIINGDDSDKALYTILSVTFPEMANQEMLLFQLDILGLDVSGGSACTSGSHKGSHVLEAIQINQDHPTIRFSFSKYNTEEEVDRTMGLLKEAVGSRQ